jgi:quercetin dioxygenase-like cupin family protein
LTYSVVDASDWEERRKPIARTLGAQAIRLNRFDSQPGQAGKEHDESQTGQEEIYIPVAGRGWIRIDGEEVELEPGRFVLVSADATRQVIASDEGLSYVVVGAAP